MDKAYISNIAPGWPPERQEALLAERLLQWPVPIYRDILKPRQLKARDLTKLEYRKALTRLTGRTGTDTIHVASLAVMAWRSADFRSLIESMAARRAVLMAHTENQLFDLSLPEHCAAVIDMFPISRTISGRERGRANGATVSASRRNAASKAACERIKDRWRLPSLHYPTTTLIAETGLSRNTVQKWLGKRPAAQARHQRNLKRQEQKATAEVVTT